MWFYVLTKKPESLGDGYDHVSLLALNVAIWARREMGVCDVVFGSPSISQLDDLYHLGSLRVDSEWDVCAACVAQQSCFPKYGLSKRWGRQLRSGEWCVGKRRQLAAQTMLAVVSVYFQTRRNGLKSGKLHFLKSDYGRSMVKNGF